MADSGAWMPELTDDDRAVFRGTYPTLDVTDEEIAEALVVGVV